MAPLMKFRRTKSRRLLLDYSMTISMNKTLLGLFSRYRVADILLHMKLVSRASRLGLTVGFLRILCCNRCAQLKDSILKNLTTRVVLDAETNPTLSLTTMNVSGCTTYLLLSGDVLQYVHREIISCMN